MHAPVQAFSKKCDWGEADERVEEAHPHHDKRRWASSRLKVEAHPVAPSKVMAPSKVKVGVYNRQEGERVVSLPQALVHSMVLEKETVWHHLNQLQAVSTSSSSQPSQPQEEGQQVPPSCKAEVAEASLVHLWARTACGNATLVENMPQSHLWV
jgi:hypothetical protein